MAAPKYREVVVHKETLESATLSELMSAVTRSMWEGGVPEEDIELFCADLSDSQTPMDVVATWVTVK